ncbi:zinc finger protein 84-like [Anopheles marshallii]|uniref:zinc finger protein 84-like n=1 Tax=Anopheles marshallii TaxID=1521116 RepID=UPI00237AAE35|nr:zinc finger protein 84-like [Anopheles marshallii]
MAGKTREVCRLCLSGSSLLDIFSETDLNGLIATLLSITGKKRYIYDCKQTYRKQLVECDICHKSLPKTRLEGHRNVHLGMRPLKCERGCEQNFHCKQLLLHHYRNVHNGETHCCDVCGKVLRSKRSLGYHQRDSHGEKKYPCSFCDQLFVSNARLNQHLKYHRGDRKYRCKLCEYSFYSSNDLKKHLTTHRSL